MLKNNKIEIFISYRNYTHYLKLGYKPVLNKNLEILTEHLPTSSHVKVDVICEICGKENTIIYHKYIINKKRHGFYGCKSCSRQKTVLTSNDKYGVDNYSKTDEFKKRVEKTNLEKFGYKTNLLNPDHKERIKNTLMNKYGTCEHWKIRKSRKKLKFNNNILNIKGQVIIYSEDLYDNNLLNNDYISYRRECRRLTSKNLKKLYEEWDGYDYYDKSYIKDNFKLDNNDPNYPTIDHKISIYYGFINNILIEDISDISNLCITKRYINSIKRESIEQDFSL